ncbi:MAG: FAD-dependent oxidoreductase, partial [Dehalococcoidales bacterium]|nr:FAD-dependent oxidoreductase [Dehalococcoidales bacterium]
PNIEQIPHASLIGFAGQPGDFKATLKVKSRWVIEAKCTACGLCASVCPVASGDEFNLSLNKRKAIYVRNPQAIPNVYTIDRETCTRCGKCMAICPTKAVVLDMPDENRELNVGAVVISTGSGEFDAAKMGQYGYGRYPNVVTNIQLERLLSNAGPTGGVLIRPSDKKTPKKIAILQCVGSRDTERGYCSEVCCMYALKEGQMIRDRYPDAAVTIFYMDIRAFGKDYYRYHLQAKEKGVQFARSRVSRIRENPKTQNLFLLARAEDGQSLSAEYDLVVLSIAQCPSPYIADLSKTLQVKTNRWGFIETPDYRVTRTTREGIFVSGSASGPSDISETVLQSSAAAGEAAAVLAQKQKLRLEKPATHAHKTTQDEAPRIAVFICKCGEEISSVVDVPTVIESAKRIPGVVSVTETPFPCLPDGVAQLKKAVKTANANRVILAACTPYRYQRLFGEALAEVEIINGMWQLVNFREQLAWVHKNHQALATRKAATMVGMAVAKLKSQEPLTLSKTKMHNAGLVIGGGISGLTAALSLAEQGYEVSLVEKSGELGGHTRRLFYDLHATDPQIFLKETMAKVQNNPLIKIYLNAELAGASGHAGHFQSQIKSGDGAVSAIVHGALIIATGAQDYQPAEYLYGKDAHVVTQHELQQKLAEGKLGKPRTVVMIQCVGSRNEAHPYCNRICCSEAIINAIKIKEQSPETQVFVLNRDIMAYGFKEPYYLKARELGVLFQRYEPEKEPRVKSVDKGISISWNDPVIPGRLEITADLLVLSTGYVAAQNQTLAGLLKLALTADGFYKEMDTKFRPVDTVKDGIFITGLANAPRNLLEKVVEAQAAAQRAANILSRSELSSGKVVSEVDKRRCSCCGLCVAACPFDARSLDEEEKVAVVEEALCQACGICATICPNSAARVKTSKDKQIFSMIEAGI